MASRPPHNEVTSITPPTSQILHTSPEKLDPEAIRQYEMYLLNERKMSPQSMNAFVASVQFLYTVTLEMP